jgi:RNA polymerase sigma factor (sigma-70 family)
VTRGRPSRMPDRRQRFEQIILPHMDAAYNLARWLTRDDQDARDVVQEAMLRAYRFLDGLRGEARPWLLALVRNAAMTWLKQNRPAELAGGDPAAAHAELADEVTPEMLALRAVDRRLINEALAALPVQFREALILRELEELSYRDIARVVDAPIGTVMSRLARGRRLLADALRAIARAAEPKVHK